MWQEDVTRKLKNVTLVKAIASSSCIKEWIVVISIGAHIIITMYNVKEKEIKNKKTKHKSKRQQIKEKCLYFFLGMLKMISLNLLKVSHLSILSYCTQMILFII